MTNVKKPLTLSIIIPVYNEARYLKECLKAIENQSVKADRVIIVDNNSTDESVKIANKFKFVTVVSEKEQGIVHARNRGFDASKTDIIGRIDADTILPRGWAKFVKEYYADDSHKNDAWTGGGTFRNTRFPRLLGWMQSQVAFRFNRLLMGHYILWGSNMAITHDQWRRVKKHVCVDDDIHEDLDLAIHLHRMGINITYDAGVKASMIMKRIHDNEKLHENLMLWPQTLKKHRRKTWILGWFGAKYIYSFRRMVWAVSKERA